MGSILGSFPRCEWQKQPNYPDTPPVQNWVRTQKNLEENAKKLKEDNPYNTSSYVCWTNSTDLHNRESHIGRSQNSMLIYFYSLASRDCLPQIQNCYCDSVCHLSLFQDCCLQCWPARKLGCNYHDMVKQRFQSCDRVGQPRMWYWEKRYVIKIALKNHQKNRPKKSPQKITTKNPT